MVLISEMRSLRGLLEEWGDGLEWGYPSVIGDWYE